MGISSTDSNNRRFKIILSRGQRPRAEVWEVSPNLLMDVDSLNHSCSSRTLSAEPYLFTHRVLSTSNHKNLVTVKEILYKKQAVDSSLGFITLNFQPKTYIFNGPFQFCDPYKMQPTAKEKTEQQS